MKLKKGKCPMCGEQFDLEYGLEENDYTSCPECYSELKLVRLEPPVLEAVREEYTDDFCMDGEDDSF